MRFWGWYDTWFSTNFTKFSFHILNSKFLKAHWTSSFFDALTCIILSWIVYTFVFFFYFIFKNSIWQFFDIPVVLFKVATNFISNSVYVIGIWCKYIQIHVITKIVQTNFILVMFSFEVFISSFTTFNTYKTNILLLYINFHITIGMC